MIMSPDQIAGPKRNIQIGNKSFEIVEQFKYLGTTLKIEIPFMKEFRAD
jgi:hypothetical protein